MDADDRADFDRMDAGIRIAFDELRSTSTQPLLTARINGSDPVVTVCSFEGRHIVTVKDYRSMEAAEAAIAGPSQAPAERWWRRWRPGSRR
jgi:hypothetical protein